MRRNYLILIISIVSVCLGFSFSLYANSDPPLHSGKKFRIGYYEGGPYSDYTDTMRMFIYGLIELGWIAEKTVPIFHIETPKAYWGWLTACESQFLSFRKEDSYSALWDDDKRLQLKEEVLEKLRSKSLDLVIAMGTWAGQDLANNKHSVPVLVMSTSNPVAAGIIKSAANSGYDHVTARVDSSRYLRQIRMFHRIVGFKSLGVAFENSPDGRIYSVIDEVEQIARERDFKPVYCEVNDTTADIEKSDRSCMECYKKLAASADAVYITALTCADRQMKSIAELFKEHNIPTFSLNGSKFVREGLLLSISSDSGYNALGRYYARKFGEIVNGARPIDLKQEFEDPLDIAVNLKTAESIGFEVPPSILKIAAEVYR